jgi:hypothetical protein
MQVVLHHHASSQQEVGSMQQLQQLQMSKTSLRDI